MTVETLIQHYGYLAVLVGTFLEGETVLVLAGFAAHRGYFDFPWVLLAAFAGTLFGDQLFFFLGRRYSTVLLRRRPGWVPRIARARKLIERHRVLVILSFRFIYGMRTVTPFALGMSEVKFREFLVLNAVGATAWTLAVGGAGYLFGQVLELFLGNLRHYELGIFAILAGIGALVWLIHFLRSRFSGGPEEE